MLLLSVGSSRLLLLGDLGRRLKLRSCVLRLETFRGRRLENVLRCMSGSLMESKLEFLRSLIARSEWPSLVQSHVTRRHGSSCGDPDPGEQSGEASDFV